MGWNLCWMLRLYVSFVFLSLSPKSVSSCFFNSNVFIRYFFIPETKGLSLEQIDLLYRESSGTSFDLFILFLLTDLLL